MAQKENEQETPNDAFAGKARALAKANGRLLAGSGLILLAVLMPAGHTHGVWVVISALDNHWGQHLEWDAVWCCVKLILFAIGLMLVLNVVADALIRLGHAPFGFTLSVMAFLFAALAGLGFYDLAEALF